MKTEENVFKILFNFFCIVSLNFRDSRPERAYRGSRARMLSASASLSAPVSVRGRAPAKPRRVAAGAAAPMKGAKPAAEQARAAAGWPPAC